MLHALQMLFPGRFVADEEGQTMAEYGLIMALVSVAAIAALTLLGPAIKGTFDTVVSAF